MNATIQSQVERSQQGDQEAFAGLVREHQSLICSVTYAACGNLTQSEDLAQETFIIAWTNLHKLKDPKAFKSWLCGIARNLIRQTFQRHQNKPNEATGSDDTLQQLPATAPCPAEEVSRSDDSALVWKTLEQLPETYRVPMVLYYREEHSIERVAALLELTQETARQRLSRGRALLKSEISKQVESTLFQTRPTKAFTLAVVSALPAFAGTAVAAGIGAGSAKGSVWLLGTSWTLLLNVLIGPLIGILGGWFGYKASMKAAKSEMEKDLIRSMTRWLLVLIGSMFLPLITIVYAGYQGSISDKIFALSIVILCLGYGVGLFGLIFYWNQKLAAARQKSMEKEPILYSEDIEAYEFRTQSTFLGLPWIHICRGSMVKGRFQKATAKGWFAFGDIAYSPLVAMGSVAIAPVAIGAIALGGFSMGGLALGGLAFGGFGVGWKAFGGLTLGFEAIGGLAIAWKAAFGGVALARDMAIGGVAMAQEANTSLAKEWFDAQPFLKSMIDITQRSPWVWFVVGFSPMVLMGLANIIKKRYAMTTGTGSLQSEWVIQCPKCQQAHPLGMAGGFRRKASSFEKRTLGFCRSCRRFRWMRILIREK